VTTGELFDARLALVTGKGGVGKSTLAAALAVAAARHGKRTCLIEVEGRQTMSKLFGTQPWDFSEREFRPGLWGLSIDPEASLAEYLDQFYGARPLKRLVASSTAVEFATTAAPGIKDVLLIGKVMDMERRERDGMPGLRYDLLVMDAPPTGRIINFLRAPEATTQLVNMGPIRNQAQRLIDLLEDSERTVVHLAALLEEMPVQETVEAAHALDGLGVRLGAVLANRVLPERFDEQARAALDTLDAASLAATYRTVGLDLDERAASHLRELGAGYVARLELQDRMRKQLTADIDRPVVELPYVYAERFGEDEVGLLADALMGWS